MDILILGPGRLSNRLYSFNTGIVLLAGGTMEPPREIEIFKPFTDFTQFVPSLPPISKKEVKKNKIPFYRGIKKYQKHPRDFQKFNY